MKIKAILSALAVLGMTLSGSAAHAAGDTGVYIAPRISFNVHQLTDFRIKGPGTNQKLDTGYDQRFGLALALGYDFYVNQALPFRAEAEFMYVARGKESDSTGLGNNIHYSQKNEVKALFFNGYYDLHNSTIFTPYVGAGLGVAWIKSSGSLNGWGAGNESDTNLAWNVGVGVGVELNYNATLDFGYRYARLGEAQTSTSLNGYHLKSNLGLHQFTVGLRYAF